MAGVWAALNHPILFAIFLVVFILFLAWVLPKLWRGIKKLFGFIGKKLGLKKDNQEENIDTTQPDSMID